MWFLAAAFVIATVVAPEGGWQQIPSTDRPLAPQPSIFAPPVRSDPAIVPPPESPRFGESARLDASPIAGADVFVGDGAEVGLAVGVDDPESLVIAINQGFSTTASVLSSFANSAWIESAFPIGSGSFTGSPGDPWANAGNESGVFFVSFFRRDATGSGSTRALVARSPDAGATWTRFYEHLRPGLQDRPMFDVDRTPENGGGEGGFYDGRLYLSYDSFEPTDFTYRGSFLLVLSPTGAALTELEISSADDFNGDQLQPVAGTADGQVYVMGAGQSRDGDGVRIRFLIFHEVTEGGAGVLLNKSLVTAPATGQELGVSSRYGLNGHRINNQMFMDVDRTDGPRRGFLYVLADSNPNQLDPGLDQGDLSLLVSADGAQSWEELPLPDLEPGKTQFFPMLDVDDNGWIHAAYYQNESGLFDDGVLNADTANVYYTFSTNGGADWSTPVQVNDPAHALDYEDPPPDRAAVNYYLVGDYNQIRAAGEGEATTVYVCWSGYDRDRGDRFVGDKRERVYCTTVLPRRASLACVGDCDGDGRVDTGELVRAIRIALGLAHISACPSLDRDRNRQLRIDEILLAVASAMEPCRGN